MLWLSLLSMLACAPDAPAPEPDVEVVQALAGRVVVTLPDDLPGDLALQLAAFHAEVVELDGWVFDIGPVRAEGQRHALTDEVLTATLSGVNDTLNLLVCRPDCVSVSGDAVGLATEVAALLDAEGDRTAWTLPTDEALVYAKRGARVLYGFEEPVLARRVGSRRDPVARAPREMGATPLTSWMQGHRDVRIGRGVPGAQALLEVVRERATVAATYDLAGAYLAAGWPDEAWETVRHDPLPDLRYQALYGHIAHHRGRADEALRVVTALPRHPETHRLAFLLDGSSQALAAWRLAAPDDVAAWNASWTAALRSGRGEELAGLLQDGPERPAGVTDATLSAVVALLDTVSTLDGLLTEAESVARETAVVQNRFGERRSIDVVPCADEAMEWVDDAYALGVRHRDLVQQSRQPHAAMTEVLEDTRVSAAIGPDYEGDLAALTDRFDVQMRTSKVLRAYHERILLARTCPDRT